MKGIETVFAGILAIVVLGVALYLLAGSNIFGPRQPAPPEIVVGPTPGGPAVASAEDVLCQCYDQAFDLAGENVGVMSSQYRTGFESCRAVAGATGGEAWTAGWNARVSSKPFQASCRAWLRTI
ncbi:MAG: hypothetical protein HXY21_13785 [Parvularculaceae bacterium]|nr:hypothetical protein [Parvularculaceae bacterium]